MRSLNKVDAKSTTIPAFERISVSEKQTLYLQFLQRDLCMRGSIIEQSK